MTRFDAGPIKVEKQWFPLEDVVGSALGRLRKELVGRAVNKRTGPDLPLVPLDGVLIEQVLVNLLENALRYSDDGTALEIIARAGDGGVVVADCRPGQWTRKGRGGAGIREAVPRFRFAHTSERGAGLGLAIARAIVNAHGGRIWAENRDGGGAVFSFVLPVEGSPPDIDIADMADE